MRSTPKPHVQTPIRSRPWWSTLLTFVATPLLVTVSAVLMLSALAPASAGATVHAQAVSATRPVPTTTAPPPTTTPPTTTPATTVAPPPPATTVAPPPPTTTVPPPAPASAAGGVPPQGQATAYGCGPALAYMAAYSAPGFQLVCPGDAQGHQATTCISSYPCAPGQKMIVIADPCPAAYMNEAHNSWAVQDGGVIDPYGYCRS